MHIYPFEKYADVTDEAVTESFFLIDRKHLLSKLVSSKENELGKKLGLFKNKSKTCLLKHHIIIESLLCEMGCCLDFTKGKSLYIGNSEIIKLRLEIFPSFPLKICPRLLIHR